MAHCHHKDESRLEMIVNHDDDNDKKMMNWIYTNNDKKVINWKYVNSLDNLDMSKEFEFLRREYPYISFDTDLKPGLVFEMNGTRYKCSLAFDPRFGSPTLYFEKHLMKKWPMELHKYSLDLFRITNELEMILNVDDPSDLHESQIIKDLYLHNSSKLLDTRIVDEFFENVKVQNSLSINVLSMTGFVSDYSKIWNIPNVFIACNNWVHSRQLIRFKGKNAFFGRNTNYDITQDMNAFLKHWLNSDNTNLETMVFYGDSTNMVQLFDGIQTSRWDPEKRQARYVSKVP
ncbi:hypothetical protein B9Z55_013655 [Caenorhabditis nigoni]|uniref:Sdz-33 F-box domain-containing protein n=1 Tax=Caenorhabditis nigoni TaxID=1611254 RepID=A0A2G5U372_9PELO|nr:hypothetical protein B9Z55_013655 [Caenorhabditis nigoni]